MPRSSREPRAAPRPSSTSWRSSAPTRSSSARTSRRAAIDDDALAAAQLRELAERAAARGMRIAYEALAWGRACQHVRPRVADRRARRPSRARHLPGQLPHPLARLGPGGHPRRSPARRSSSCSWPTRRTWSWTCCSGAATTAASRARAASTSPRCCARRCAAGYAGPLSLEVFNDVFRAADPEPDGRRRDALAADPRGRAARPPAPLDGYAFAELGLDADLRARDRGDARGARLHPHRPAPLQARAAVGAGRRARRRQPRRGAGRRRAWSRSPSRRPTPTPRPRAPRRCRPRSWPARRRPDEAALRSVAAPDGTSVIFCRRLAPRLPARSASAAAGPLRAIDHLALVAALRLLRRGGALLPLGARPDPHESQELAAPDGLIRSRAVGDPERRVRLALNVPLGRRGATELQHIAFACDDALAAARRCADAGVPLLRIPGNYYDDLAARTDLDPGRSRSCATRASSTTPTSTASCCTSSPRSSATGCSSRSWSGAAATTATAPPTPPSASARSGRRA